MMFADHNRRWWLAGGLFAASCGGPMTSPTSVRNAAHALIQCVDARQHPLAGSCGADDICRDAMGRPIAGASCIDANLICVNGAGAVVATASCGEDHQCRDANGFLIEGVTCIAQPIDACAHDAVPPHISVAPRQLLWPPNHSFHRVTLADCGVSAVDDCDGLLDVARAGEIDCVESSEGNDDPDDRQGAHSGPDIVVIDAHSVDVRSEREGTGPGRLYAIGFTIHDRAGNAAHGMCGVFVPHDRGRPSATMPVLGECR
jgi:hypothetical protein